MSIEEINLELSKKCFQKANCLYLFQTENSDDL